MFLIDSSVWIEYLRPKRSAKIKDKVRELLKSGDVVVCGVVLVEILIYLFPGFQPMKK